MNDEEKVGERLIEELTELHWKLGRHKRPVTEGLCSEAGFNPRNAQSALAGGKWRHSRGMLKSILDTCPVGIAFIERDKLRWMNAAWEQMFRLDGSSRHRDKSAGVLFESEEAYQRVFRMLWTRLIAGGVTECDAEVRRADGSIFAANIRLNMIDAEDPSLGHILVITDISARKSAEEELRKRKEEMEALLNATPELALLIDTHGNIMACNEALAAFTGQSLDVLRGRCVYDLMPPELAEIRRQWVRRVVETGKPVNWEDEDRRKIFYNILVPIRGSQATVEGAAVFSRDITEHSRAQEGAVQAQKLAAVAELASGVAHNFNNILQIVLGGSQLAQSDLDLGDIDGAQDCLTQVIESARAGAETVKRLQEFARVRNVSQGGQGKVFDLARSVEDAIGMTKPWWNTRPDNEGFPISLKRHLRTGCFVKGIENDLFEVAVNLIKNAAEALPRGGEIRVSVGVEGSSVMLIVQDNGTGIAQKDKGRIFEPFWTTKGCQGTGMGLSSTLGIVQRHAGKISVESREGEGTIFTVQLPFSPDEESSKQPALPECQKFRLHILVVDDLSLVTNQIASTLTNLGQTVFTALNGRQALRIFRETHIDLIICDLGMPGLNGWQVGERIKEICRELGRFKPPFIMLTGWGGQLDERERMNKGGVDRIIEKPVDGFQLMDAIRELTKARFQD